MCKEYFIAGSRPHFLSKGVIWEVALTCKTLTEQHNVFTKTLLILCPKYSHYHILSFCVWLLRGFCFERERKKIVSLLKTLCYLLQEEVYTEHTAMGKGVKGFIGI